MKKTFAYVTFVLVTASLASVPANAQISVGADLVSRYIWRGVDYGNSPGFQPSLSYASGPFSIGSWGSYAFAGTNPPFSEQDIWASYDLDIGRGSISVLLTDYYYPNAGLKFFDFDAIGGAHVLEAGFGYTGPPSIPFSFKAYYNFHNDPDNSVYLEGAYGFSVDEIEVTAFLGGTMAASAWYATDGAALINVGMTASKSVVITESYSLPVFGTYLLNPELEQSYLIVGFRF